MVDYLDFDSADKHLYLYDTFAGKPDVPGDESPVPPGAFSAPNLLAEVTQRFSGHSNVHVVPGVVPDSLIGESPQQVAAELGFEAMQFNSVVSTNEVAVELWQKLGFDIIGTVHKAYRHGRLGYVDSLIMYKWLRT